jgi:uncharacterized repeat protein (TIGR01451 family)
VHDRAVVSGTSFGTPTGNVSFTWFTNGDCSGDGVAAGTVTLTSGFAHPSDAFGPLAAGSYSFEATYNGDDNYKKSTADCEPLTVTKADSSTVTQIHDAEHNVVTSVALGARVQDRAVVTGTSFGTPTGNVSFTWFTNGSCDLDGVAAGTVTLASGVAHPSDEETPATAGAHSFRAVYEGDANYNASTGSCEPLTVTLVDLSIAKTDGGARPVAGDGTFTYTLAVDNLGPSDAQEDATVVDVLPAEISFASFGALPAGVTCDPPVGQTITCTIAKDLLEVSDGPVLIPIAVGVQAGTTVASVTNQAIVTSPEDPAPCTVTSTNITCDPSGTNNYAQVVTPLAAVAGITTPSPATPALATHGAAPVLAFTGSGGGRLMLIGLALVVLGAISLFAAHRPRKKVRSR